MPPEVLIDLIYHIALLLAAAVVFDLCVSRQTVRAHCPPTVMGLLLSALALGLVLLPIRLESGIQLNAAPVMVAVSGLFFSFVPTAILVVLALMATFLQGDIFIGAVAILLSGGLGLLWRKRLKKQFPDLADVPLRELLYLGILVHGAVLAGFLGAPGVSPAETFSYVALPVLLFFPVATLALGAVLRGRLRRVRAVDELEANRDHFRTLTRAVEQSPASVVITDRKGNIEYVNAKFTAVTGYAAEEVLGKNPRILKSGNIPPDHYKRLWTELSAGREWQGEFLNRRKDGTTFWELASISPVLDEKGHITSFLAIKEDITEKKAQAQRIIEAKEEAERANRAKSAFLAVVSHELRTPLNAITGPCQLALENARDPDDREMLETALASSHKLLSLIDRILSFAEVESDNSGLKPEPIDLHELVASSILDHAAAAHDKGVGIGLSAKSTFPEAFCSDLLVLRQILLNLIDNAVKFTDRGSVSVSVHVDGEKVSISVTDTGCGIPEETREAIFEFFSQGDMTVRRAHSGVGLGLSIVKVLTERIGGRLNLESQTGKGSVFTLQLPLCLERHQEAAAWQLASAETK